jgi:hypothetical protein
MLCVKDCHVSSVRVTSAYVLIVWFVFVSLFTGKLLFLICSKNVTPFVLCLYFMSRGVTILLEP